MLTTLAMPSRSSGNRNCSVVDEATQCVVNFVCSMMCNIVETPEICDGHFAIFYGTTIGVVGHLVLCFGRSRRDEMAKGIPASGTAVERTAQVSAALRAWVCVAAGAHRVWLAQPRKRSRRAVESWFMRLCSCSISKLSSATRR